MTGTGTQADPYIVETWAEFASVCNISTSTYIVWEDGETDFNDVQPEGFSAKILIKGNITLRRCIFRNAAFQQTDWAFQFEAGSAGILFEECKILDVEHYVKSATRKGFIYRNSGTVTFDKCELSYQGNGGNNTGTEYLCYHSSNSGTVVFNRCAVKFKYSSSYSSGTFSITNSDYSGFTYCNIELDVSCANMNGLFPGLICWYSGSIALTQNCSISSSGSPGSVVVDVECSHTITYTSASAYSYMILYNSEKATLSGDRVVGVTTAQLEDTECLAGIGFPAREGGNGS